MTPQEFIKLLNGVWISVKADGLSIPGKIDTECYDLAQLRAFSIGAPRFTTKGAAGIYDQPGAFFNQIPNGPTNYPVAGDIVVFTYDHVGICTGNNTNSMQVELLEQNDPVGSETHIKIYKYKDANGRDIIRGWLHPKKAV